LQRRHKLFFADRTLKLADDGTRRGKKNGYRSGGPRINLEIVQERGFGGIGRVDGHNVGRCGKAIVGGEICYASL
jgi:hypothetical protein